MLHRHARRAFVRPVHLALAALLALPAVIGATPCMRSAEAAAPPLNWTYKDRVHKFSMKMMRDYQAVPQKVDEKTVVAKFSDPKSKGANRGSYPISIEVIRIALEGQDKPVTTGDGKGDKGDMARRIREMMSGFGEPKSVWEAMLSKLAGWRLDAAGKKTVDKYQKTFKKIKSKDKPAVPGKLWQFEAPVVNPWDKEMLHMTCAEFQKDGFAYGLLMTCGTRLEKHYAKAFKKIAKSFMWYDKSAKEVESLDVLEGVNITAKKRSEIERSMVKGWDVIISPKNNYIVLYNTKNGKNHLLAKVIAKRIEAIREQVYEVQFPPAKPITTVCIVRVCKDRKEYHAYGGPGGSAGYWSSRDEELVFYDASASKKPDDDTLSVLYHEAFHQYIYYSVGDVAPHSWFNEGHGDYYAGAKYKGGKFRIEPFQWRVGTIKGALVQGPRPFTEESDASGQARKRWGNTGYTPLQDLVKFSQREYYSYPGVCYAQGWSLIYFLREIVPKNKKYNEKWGHILETYFNTLQNEVNKDGALKRGGEGDEKDGDDKKEKKDGDDKKEKKDGDADEPTTPPNPREDGGDGEGDTDGEKEDGDSKDGEGDAEEEALDIARVFFRGRGGPDALKKAVEEAFKGVDWEEFEAAWLKCTKRGK